MPSSLKCAVRSGSERPSSRSNTQKQHLSRGSSQLNKSASLNLSTITVSALKASSGSLKTIKSRPATQLSPWQYSISGLQSAYALSTLISTQGSTPGIWCSDLDTSRLMTSSTVAIMSKFASTLRLKSSQTLFEIWETSNTFCQIWLRFILRDSGDETNKACQ